MKNEMEADQMIVFVNSDNFEEEVIRSDELVLADFYSESCIPCKMLSPMLYEFKIEIYAYYGILKP